MSKDTPESFVWHTFDDNSVPLENSLLFVEALRKNNVKFEYHVFPDGCHDWDLELKKLLQRVANIISRKYMNGLSCLNSG